MVQIALRKTINTVSKQFNESSDKSLQAFSVLVKQSLRGKWHLKQRSCTASYKSEVINKHENGENIVDVTLHCVVKRILVIK